jgi:glucose-6-phosphate isomerase
MVNNLDFDFSNSRVPNKDILKHSKKLNSYIQNLIEKKFENENENCLFQPFDFSEINKVKELISEKKPLHPSMIIVIGIGGSNLATMALEEALIDRYDSHRIGIPRIYYADTVDSDNTFFIKKEMEIELAKGRNVLIVAVTKSGNTIETIANFEIFIDSARKFVSDYKKFLVTISDKDSLLTKWAIKNNLSHLTIPKYVSGRYSVFSAVSLFPIGMLGVNIDELFEGAREMNKICLSKKNNPAILSAAIHFYHYQKKINITNTFIFDKSLENLGRWYRQLNAESLGKRLNLKNKKVNIGFTPITTIGTVDLHSMQQLIIEGPKDKLNTFVSCSKEKNDISVPLLSRTGLIKDYAGMKFDLMMSKILKAVEITYKKEKKPFISVVIPIQNPYFIGQFMMWKMFEIVFLAKLFNINPFNQPGVESYKKEVNKILTKN